MKVLLFGTGEYYNRYKIWFENEQILALIDNSPEKQGKMIDGIRVLSPADIIYIDFDAIFIMSFYVLEMKKQLIDLGVPKEKIHHFYDIHDVLYNKSLNKEVTFYGDFSKEKEILLLNQDLTLGGPALALYNVAKILKRNGYSVTYGSQIDGALREYLESEGIPVVVDLNLLVQRMDECDWIKGYSLIICNTINFHVFLSKRDIRIPVIWWLHDSLFFYDGINKRAIDSISNVNLKVWGVGPVSENAIKTFRPDFEVSNLLYGVEDVADKIDVDIKKTKDFFQFVTIGYIEKRKGQDILIESIKKIPNNIRNKLRFILVGQNTSILAKRIMKECEGIEEVEFTGVVNREKIYEILRNSDIMICPSREDPMPTVCAEAMMYSVPCIVSDAVGTAKYIEDNVNGRIFQNENSDELAERIIEIINNNSCVCEMAIKARKTFDDYFAMHVFENNLMKLMRVNY